MESRIRGNVYVRFGGEKMETYYRNIARRRGLILRIVTHVKNDLVYSIEGNTNVNGSREGDGVYRRVRHVRSIYRFADWLKK